MRIYNIKYRRFDVFRIIVRHLKSKNRGFKTFLQILDAIWGQTKSFENVLKYNLQLSYGHLHERRFYINAYMKLKNFHQSLHMQVILTIKLQMSYVQQRFGENQVYSLKMSAFSTLPNWNNSHVCVASKCGKTLLMVYACVRIKYERSFAVLWFKGMFDQAEIRQTHRSVFI